MGIDSGIAAGGANRADVALLAACADRWGVSVEFLGRVLALEDDFRGLGRRRGLLPLLRALAEEEAAQS